MKNVKELKIIQYCCMVDYCGKAYSTRFNLKKHMEIVHLRYKRFKCPECGNLFSSNQNLIEHSYMHQGVKPYTCSQCHQAFRHISSLSLHKRHHAYEEAEQKSLNAASANRY